MLAPYEIDLTETDMIPQALQNVSDYDENNSAPEPPMFDKSIELYHTSLDDTKSVSRETWRF
jgi:beta-xylosidase